MARPSAITLNNSGFSHDGCQYLYEHVSSLYFYYVVTDVRINLMHAGDDHDAELDIYVDSRPRPIKIRTGAYFTYLTIDRTERRANSVVELYHEFGNFRTSSSSRNTILTCSFCCSIDFSDYDGTGHDLHNL